MWYLKYFNCLPIISERSFRRLVAEVLDCDIIVSEFELKSHYYVHFRTKTLEKSMTPPLSSAGMA